MWPRRVQHLATSHAPAVAVCLLVTVSSISAQEPRAPVSAEARRAIMSFFEYDRDVPLNARVVDEQKTPTYRRQKIVFTGVRDARVPGYLTLPVTADGPFPLVLLLHAGASSKETWFKSDGLENGAAMIEALLAAGFAALSLDAQYHGERAADNDYESIVAMYFERKWFHRFKDMVLQSSIDYRRAIDYVESRPDIDANRIGALGHSMGGIMTFYLTALDERVDVGVACVAAISEPRLEPLSPIDFAGAIVDKPFLMLAGRTDGLSSVADSETVFSNVASQQKKLKFFDSGHSLPAAYVADAVEWFTAHLR